MSNDTPTVEGTISALEGGVTSLPLDAALANIQGWQTTLAGSDDPAAQGLSAQLGEGTTAVAGGDAQLTNLGNLLQQAGGSL